jgi:predicted Rossmann fold flavoprotein
MKQRLKIAVIGGGAAGFFSAISAKHHFPNSSVTIYEKSAKLLSKVKISGGGRCNVTHACFDNLELSKFYPRGERQLRKAFEQFNVQSTIDWFKKRNVDLVTLPDNCIFPKSNSSQTIIDCFLQEATRLGIEIKIQCPINKLEKTESNHFKIYTADSFLEVDRIIITTGGQPKLSNLDWLLHRVVEPVPSLFTFNMPNEPIKKLMGIVVEQATVKIEKTKLSADGPLLITHWGMSGPAILKLSAWGARIFAEKEYKFAVLVNWLNDKKEEELIIELSSTIQTHAGKMISNWNPFSVPNRLWLFLLDKIGISCQLRWKDIGKKNVNKLMNVMLNDRYEVSGKTTFKEEFVTAGGVSLDEVNFQTLESRKISGMFFAGEILDIDGITGGFNFQAAWTTAWIAGKNVGKET